MQAAILCPGHPLATAEIAPAEVVIGVNRAVCHAACDYAVMLDAHTYGFCERVGIKGRPTIVTSTQIWGQMCRMFPAAAHHRFLAIDAGWLAGGGLRWRSKGLCVSLVLAKMLGADAATCYGVGWTGTTDWDGHSDAKQRRTPDRWKAERALVGEVVAMLPGMTVEGLPK
jgi:hypothetical protein